MIHQVGISSRNKSVGKVGLVLLCSFVLIFSCQQTNSPTEKKKIKTKIDKKINPKISKLNKDSLAILKFDSIKLVSPKKISSSRSQKVQLLRMSESVTNDKLNGAPIMIQEDLSAKEFSKDPEQLKNRLRGYYLWQERNFPRSIADDFENGISRELISYPRLNYVIELFEDGYASTPYKILNYSVRKEKDSIVVE
jgi:hypothetical protein